MIALRCLLAGHDDSLDRHTLRVHCERCGRVSSGVDMAHHHVKGQIVETPTPNILHETPDGRERLPRRGLRRVRSSAA